MTKLKENAQSEQFLFYEDKDFTLYKGKMQDVLSTFEENSIDSIVCDPPYELNFMGKGWDNQGIAFKKDTWEHCFRVLKEGGYLLAFGGSRTFHRIACAIEDAGFEIRDTIMWLYGYLSNDTEILTSNGWKNSETIRKNDFIYSLDLDKNIIIKNKVQNVFKYDYDGEMVSLKNQNTDQLLTPNHHCIVKDKVRTRIKNETKYYKNNDSWYYKDAWRIRSQNVTLPLASNYNGDIEIGNLFAELLGWVISEGTYHKDTNAISITQSSVNSDYVKRIRYVLGKLNIKYSEYSRLRVYKGKEYTEYDFYIGKESVDVVNKIKEIAPNKKLTYKLLDLSLSNKEFLLKGLCKGDGSKAKNKFGFSAFYQKDLEQLDIFQALLHLTNKQGWVNKNKYCCSIHSNSTTEIQGKHNKERFVKYDGKYVWCIETEIGNFVARRNGKIFITGNSGFPKSMNIGKAIEAKEKLGNAGTRNKIKIEQSCDSEEYSLKQTNNGAMGEIIETTRKEYIAGTELSKKWSSWGTTLKPAYEPIIVARKPFKGSLVDNILQNGVGGLNIDECRIPTSDDLARINKTDNGMFGVGKNNNKAQQCKEQGIEYGGRFPANVILTYDENNFDEVCGGMPDTKSNGGKTTMSDFSKYKGSMMNTFNLKENSSRKDSNYIAPKDEGSASRYFYCAKASKKDRDEGLDLFETKTKVFNGKSNESSEKMKDVEKRFTTQGKNIHPTVKPVELMQYLVRLVTPKGAKVLDCFMGSGSTGKAVMFENRERNANYHFIGIEMTDEYLPIAKARIDYAKYKYQYDEIKEKEERKRKGIINIFDLIGDENE